MSQSFPRKNPAGWLWTSDFIPAAVGKGAAEHGSLAGTRKLKRERYINTKNSGRIEINRLTLREKTGKIYYCCIKNLFIYTIIYYNCYCIWVQVYMHFDCFLSFSVSAETVQVRSEMLLLFRQV